MTEAADPANAQKKDKDLDLELYQGLNAVRKRGNDKGEALSNYFEPRVMWNAAGEEVRRTDTAFVTIATTGVRGGGLVRAVVRTAQSSNPTPFRQLDRIPYTDTNVPCNNANPSIPRQFVARWVYGNFNPNAARDNPQTSANEAENAIYGWALTRVPYSPEERRNDRFGCKPPPPSP